MRVAEIVGSIARAGGYLRVLDDGNLEYAGTAELTAELRAEIQSQKPAIIAWLRTPIDEQPRVDQLALDYERTLPDWLLERIHETWGRDTVGGRR